jgi:hypothetical protein
MAIISRPDAKAVDTRDIVKADQIASWHEHYVESVPRCQLFDDLLLQHILPLGFLRIIRITMRPRLRRLEKQPSCCRASRQASKRQPS